MACAKEQRGRAARRRRSAVVVLSVALMAATGVVPSASAGGVEELAGGRAYRPFTETSWWNTPFGADAPTDRRSARWLRMLRRATSFPSVRITGLPNSSREQAHPVYFSVLRDPEYVIDPAQGPTVTIRIPLGAHPSGAASPKMVVVDRTTDQAVGLVGAAFVGGVWTATGLDRYYLSSNGLHDAAGGPDGNQGHRGAPSVLKPIRRDEIRAGVIEHRGQCFVPPKLLAPRAVFPMVGSDGDRRGGIPEGVVLQIRPSVDLRAIDLARSARVVATMLQDYGCAITDGGGPGAATIRVERARWGGTALRWDALFALPWHSWRFVAAGHGR